MIKLVDDTNPLPTFPDVLEPLPILKPFSSERKQNFLFFIFLNFLYSNIDLKFFYFRIFFIWTLRRS